MTNGLTKMLLGTALAATIAGSANADYLRFKVNPLGSSPGSVIRSIQANFDYQSTASDGYISGEDGIVDGWMNNQATQGNSTLVAYTDVEGHKVRRNVKQTTPIIGSTETYLLSGANNTTLANTNLLVDANIRFMTYTPTNGVTDRAYTLFLNPEYATQDNGDALTGETNTMGFVKYDFGNVSETFESDMFKLSLESDFDINKTWGMVEFKAVPEPSSLGLIALLGSAVLWTRKRFSR